MEPSLSKARAEYKEQKQDATECTDFAGFKSVNIRAVRGVLLLYPNPYKKTPLGHRGVTVAGNRMTPDGLTGKCPDPPNRRAGPVLVLEREPKLR